MNIPSFPKVSLQGLLKRLTSRQDLILGAAVVLCGLFFANIFYQKQQQRLKGIESEIAAEEQKIALAEELSTLDNKLMSLSSAYTKKDNSFTINKFNELAASSGAKIASLSVENEADGGLYTVTSYRLSVKADYHSLGKFISALESVADMVKIEELSLSLAVAQAGVRRSGMGGRANILNINMRISVSFIKKL